MQLQHPDKKIEVWIQDEARVGQHGTLTRVWAETGTRPRVMQDFRFESAYIFGAICPAEQKSSALIFTSVGAEEMGLHLHEVSKTAGINTHIVMIMDRAPWHKSVVVPDNISIMFLPPYSPELNPVEQVWDYLRSNYFSNRCYETIESVFDACCEAWELFSNQPALITSIGMRSWFI
jgi:transposase